MPIFAANCIFDCVFADAIGGGRDLRLWQKSLSWLFSIKTQWKFFASRCTL